MLRIHRAERADRLVDALARVVAEPLDDPFTPEIVAVPTRGVERWLTQRLSTSLGASPNRGDGVCANLSFPFPGRLVGRAVAAASGVRREADPWVPERSVWTLLEVVDDNLGARWMAPLAAHLTGGGSDGNDHRARRFASVRHLADLFDRYSVHRPAMLRAWAAGQDTDGADQPLPAETAWQAGLWRRLRDRLGTSPAERLEAACDRLRHDPAILDLPARISLFGLTRLPASYLDVLRAMAPARDVHLFLLHPSPVLWERVEGALRPPPILPRRQADPSAGLPRNPLLATWGRDAREMQLVLPAPDGEHDRQHHPVDEDPRTLLQRLQADVRGDRLPPGPPLPGRPDAREPLDPADDSLQVHACHGRARQVEVVRDAILHLLASDPSLEPRDIVVMCPDIDSFAPLIQATFGGADVGDDMDEGSPPAGTRLPELRVRLADRSLRQTNPVLAAVSELLSLGGARLSASAVIDFASREPVRRRFRFDDDDLARIERWVAAAGVRWGLDAAHRAPYELQAIGANTWRAGLDRMLLGVAMGEEGQHLVGGVLPLDDLGSSDIDLAGRLAEFVDRLHAAVNDLSRAAPIERWAQAIAGAAQALTTTTPGDAWQHAELQSLLDEVVDEATAQGRPSPVPLAPAEVQALLADRLRGRPTRANFRTGSLTMCTLVPMRSVPHRVICLLGLDDEVFPRRTAPDGDDLIQWNPRVGDRDPRSEDRQLLLDALLAAGEHLVITYSGRDERTNATRPPAVPVGELLDVIDRTFTTGTPVSSRDRVVVHHPLQPFDARNFVEGALVSGQRWSFDTVALDGARALTGPRRARGFLDGPLPPAAGDLLELDHLVRFVQHPVRAFLRQRLAVVIREGDTEVADALPVELDALEKWGVGERLLTARLAGVDMAHCRAAEVARGTLPPGALAGPVLDDLEPVVEAIAQQAAAVVEEGAEPTTVEITVDLGGGRRLVGAVDGVVSDTLRNVTYSRVAAKQRLAAWVRLLALTAAHPDRGFRAVTVGRGPGTYVTLATIHPLAGDARGRRRAALEALAVLVDIYDRGMREPLPLYCATSAAYAQARAVGDDVEAAAGKTWKTGWEVPNEDRDPGHQLVLGGTPPFRELLVAPPRDDECGQGWAADETTRFGRYARRLWDGLLAREQVTNR